MMIIVMIVMTMLMIVMMMIDRNLLTSNEPCELRRRIGRAGPASQSCLHPHLSSRDHDDDDDVGDKSIIITSSLTLG